MSSIYNTSTDYCSVITEREQRWADMSPTVTIVPPPTQAQATVGQYTLTGPVANQNYIFSGKVSALPTGATGFNSMAVVIQQPTSAPTNYSAWTTNPCSFQFSGQTGSLQF